MFIYVYTYVHATYPAVLTKRLLIFQQAMGVG